MDPIRLFVLDDEVLPLALADAISRAEDVRVEASPDPGRVAAAFDAGEADLVLVDVSSPRGYETIERLRSASDRARVLAVTDEDSVDIVVGGIGAGACGVASRRATADQFLRVIHRAVAGELVIPERDLLQAVGRLSRRTAPAARERRLEFLTARETQVLLALAAGLTTADVASKLGIRVMTVQSHVKNILTKLGVHSKVEAVTLALRSGLADSETA